jgi:hypothetical protein
MECRIASTTNILPVISTFYNFYNIAANFYFFVYTLKIIGYVLQYIIMVSFYNLIIKT